MAKPQLLVMLVAVVATSAGEFLSSPPAYGAPRGFSHPNHHHNQHQNQFTHGNQHQNQFNHANQNHNQFNHGNQNNNQFNHGNQNNNQFNHGNQNNNQFNHGNHQSVLVPPPPPPAQPPRTEGGFGPTPCGGCGGGGAGSYGAGNKGGATYGGYGGGSNGNNEYDQPKAYQFGYAVRDAASGNDYQRHERSDGNTVTGEYRVQLPDGRTQVVTYTADWQHGFRAKVTYEGEARYPSGPSYGGGGGYGGGGASSSYGPPPTGAGAPNQGGYL